VRQWKSVAVIAIPKKGRIICTEDDADSRALIVLVLTWEGYDCERIVIGWARIISLAFVRSHTQKSNCVAAVAS